MISEVINSLFLTYLASEYLIAEGQQQQQEKQRQRQQQRQQLQQTEEQLQYSQQYSIKQQQEHYRLRHSKKNITTNNTSNNTSTSSSSSSTIIQNILFKQSFLPLILFVLIINGLDHYYSISELLHNATNQVQEFHILSVFSKMMNRLIHLPKIIFAAMAYIIGLYLDIRYNNHFNNNNNNNNNNTNNASFRYGKKSNNTTTNTKSKAKTTIRMPVSTFLKSVGWAFIKVLPAYPFLAVLISFIFLFVINIWEALHLPMEWLNAPIYYGTLYGPFAYVYVHVKQQVITSSCYYLLQEEEDEKGDQTTSLPV